MSMRAGVQDKFLLGVPLPHKCGVPRAQERRIYAAAKNFVVRPEGRKE
jgi:hypothetical protein